jgi:hypothetical protein
VLLHCAQRGHFARKLKHFRYFDGELEVDNFLGSSFSCIEVVGVGTSRQVLPATVTHNKHHNTFF